MKLFKLIVLASLSVGSWSVAQAAAAPHVITLTAKKVGEKKVWEPAKVDIKEGETVTLKLVNELPEEHGFSSPGIVPATVIPAKSTKEVTFTAPATPGEVKFLCHLHPAHVPGAFEVTK